MRVANFVFPVSLIVLLGSIALDLLLGEPPEFLHPVVWIGRIIGVLKERLAGTGRDKLLGGLLVLLVVIGTGGASYLAIMYALDLWLPFGVFLAIYLLKSTLSIRSLIGTVRIVGRNIEEDLEEAREQLLALVGRDRSDLSREEMRSATIESLLENLIDSVVSPSFYFFLGTLINLETGVALAVSFKALNTLDSMIGYRSESLRDFGYLSARLDDLANWIPARLSPLLISLGSTSWGPVKVSARDWNNTSSPNSGWPMGAGSGALNLKLVKESHYVLGSEFDPPGPEDVERAISLVGRTTGIYLILLCGGIFFCSSIG